MTKARICYYFDYPDIPQHDINPCGEMGRGGVCHRDEYCMKYNLPYYKCCYMNPYQESIFVQEERA